MSDPSLIHELELRTSHKKTGSVRKNIYQIWGFPPEIQITRWKFNEWDYYSEKAKLPCSARGLFTIEDKIVCRGYNKFFNTNEVKATKAEELVAQTRGPYYATVKENGYLVLIGSLNGKLVVTSKNSSGPIQSSDERNHCKVAREWVLKMISNAGKTESEFAELLAANNWTAVGEVCDDSFEEHVLPYPGQLGGIYLNGLNHNERNFRTESPAKVREVAKSFGFHVTEFLEFGDYTSLYGFLEESSVDGKYKNREVEGFVIRCKKLGNNGLEDFFWKYKFEEPYFMYREWREVLKKYLNSSINEAYMMAKRSRHTESCIRFLQFAQQYLDSHPQLGNQILSESRGLFEIRDQFYQSGSDMNEKTLLKLDLNTPKYILVTVATLGCGKSTVGQTLSSLLGWGHRQSDGVVKKGAKFQALMDQVYRDLAVKDVCILDRNNSMVSEREKLFELSDNLAVTMGYDVKTVCLNFLPEGVTSQTMQITRDRVLARGDNHQNVKVSEMGVKGVKGLITNFEKRFEVVRPNKEPDNHFDLVINLEPGNTFNNVKSIMSRLRQQNWPKVEVPEFTDFQISEAIEQVRNQSITQVPPPVKPRLPAYFSIVINEENYNSLLKVAKDLKAPLGNVNVQNKFHVTLAHVGSHKLLHKEYRTKFSHSLKNAGPNIRSLPLNTFEPVTVTGLAWSRNVIAFKVEVKGGGNAHPHITVGTSNGFKPVMAQKLFSDPTSDVKFVELKPIVLDAQEIYAEF